jgi:hypothetical protein
VQEARRPHDVPMARINSKLPPVSRLRSQYRQALSASVVAHARYLAAQGEKNITERQIVRRKTTWEMLEARKARACARLLFQNDGPQLSDKERNP